MELCEIQCYLFCFSAVSLLFSCKIMRIFRRPIYDTFRQRILYISKYTLMHFKTFAEDFGQTALGGLQFQKGNFAGAPNLVIFGYKPRPNIKSYVPNSLREEIGFFYVPTLILSCQSFSWPIPVKGLSLRMRNGWGEEGDKSLIKLASCDI